jgi:predicted ArsR family transcriptional regulator
MSTGQRRGTPFGHPMRIRIYGLVQEHGEASPAEIARALGLRTEAVAHHVRALADHGVLTLARTVPVRGAVAHYYEIAQAAEERPPLADAAIATAEGNRDDLAAILIDLVEAAGPIPEGRIRVTCVVEPLPQQR